MAEKAQKTLETTLEEVKAKTGKTVEEFRQMAAEKGITKTSQLVQWLSSEYGLGYHQAGAINVMLFHAEKAQVNDDELIATHFSGNKAIWREGYDRLIPQVKAFGEDVEVAPNMTYINLNRKGKKTRARRANKQGSKPDTKRAIVTLAAGNEIPLFEN